MKPHKGHQDNEEIAKILTKVIKTMKKKNYK